MKFQIPLLSRSALGFLTMAFPVGSHAAELQASDGAQYDSFGMSVATSGGYALIGAENSGTGSGSYQGSVYLFRDLDNATGTITQNATLVASDRKSGDFFGRVSTYGGIAFGGSVSVNLTNGLIGAARNQNDQGSAYLFFDLDAVTGTVTQNVELTASDGKAGDLFGGAVSTSSYNALVGATGVRFGNGMNQGAAYLLTKRFTSKEEKRRLVASGTALKRNAPCRVNTSRFRENFILLQFQIGSLQTSSQKR